MNTNIVYGVSDRPSPLKILAFALQQLLAILAATIAVPRIIGNGMDTAAALFGAGVGTLVYLLFTKFKSPVFLGSSFAFLGSMASAFAGAATTNIGFTGLIIGAILAGLVYVVLAIIVKICGSGWVNKLMPPVIIGPTVAIIGLSLAGNAVGDFCNGGIGGWTYVGMICGLVTLLVIIACSVYGKKMVKMIPFIIGIAAGFILALIFSVIGDLADQDKLLILDYKHIFEDLKWVPKFAFVKGVKGFKDFDGASDFFSYFGTVAAAYVPVAFVVFAEHIADHKNLSSIIGSDLLEEPGLDKTLLGDGVGSMAGALFGGCPNTTYGESVGCVAISGNASVITIFATAILAILLSFFAPATAILAAIPNCVMGGTCIALYGFIAVSGLKMIQPVDLNDNRNLFVVSSILIAGVGGLTLSVATHTKVPVTFTEVACALVLGIIVNFVCRYGDKKNNNDVKPETEAKAEETNTEASE